MPLGFGLSGRVAIVTGAGRGIGKGIVLALAEAGADIAVSDIDVESAEETASLAAARGVKSGAIGLDVTDESSVAAAIDATLSRFGRIDILVNNAGVVQDRGDDEVTGDDFDRCYRVNLKGLWAVTSALVPHFKERGSGKIVNIASIAGRRGGPLAPYAASKAAVINLTQSQATALGPHDINVNAVCPGLLWTPMWEKLEGIFRKSGDRSVIEERAAFEAYIGANCPLRREQTPEDIGCAVVFLSSDAAKNITGQALNVDGGIQMN